MTIAALRIEPSQQSHGGLYRAVWRWHFYSGLFVVPFMLMLAISGIAMLWFTAIAPEYGDRLVISQGEKALSITEQTTIVQQQHRDGTIGQYIAPRSPTNPALFRMDLQEGARMIALDPYSGVVLRDRTLDGTWRAFFSTIHGTFMLGGEGGVGDFLIETAASLGIISLVTGLFLWWPHVESTRTLLWPQFSAKGRAWWKSMHEVVGFWMSLFLLFFLLSGLAWTTVWGRTYMQAWNTYPAEKWDNVPRSHIEHASLNAGTSKDVPWALEQTAMPMSGSEAGVGGVVTSAPVAWESLARLATALGFTGRFQLMAPKSHDGVWTISRDSQSHDSANPTADRTVHVDQYTGKILADVKFSDYPLGGKAMAVSIALHEGQTGWWNIAFNLIYCLAVVFLAVSGVVMWWKRRPAAQLGAPRYPNNYAVPKAALGLGVLLAFCFPLGGVAMACFAVFDFLLPRRLKEVRVG